MRITKESQLPYRKKGKKATVTVSEDQLQKQCNDEIEGYNIKYLRIPDGVWNWLNDNCPVHILYWLSHYFAGMPDNVMLIPISDEYNLCCQIELKTKTGKVKNKQKQWAKETAVNLSRDTETTDNIIKNYVDFAKKLKEFLEQENK